MSQADGIIADQAGAAFLADLNAQLAAIISQNSGLTEPTTTYAYQWWADTTTGILKIRNAANSAWISLLAMSTGVMSANAALAGSTSQAFSVSTLTSADATDATSSTAAAVKTAGGLAVAKKVWVGTELVIATSGANIPAAGTGRYGATAGNGLQIIGSGTTNDIILYNKNAGNALCIPTGTTNVQHGGTISVGAVIPSTSGAGITFPATQSASSDPNTLDDYEEGTWTPTINAFGGTGLTASGKYLKVGGLCYVEARIAGTNLTATLGTSYFSNMPFTPAFDSVASWASSNGAVTYGNTSATVAGTAIFAPTQTATGSTMIASTTFMNV